MGQENKEIRLNKVAKELNVGVSTIVDFLKKKGFEVENNPNHRIDMKQYDILVKEFSSDIIAKKQMEKQAEIEKERKKAISAETKAKKQAEKTENTNQVPNKAEVKVLGKIDLDKNKNAKPTSNQNSQPQEVKKQETPEEKDNNPQPKAAQNKPSEGQNFKVLGKIDLNSINTKTRPDKKSKSEKQQEREQRQKDNQQAAKQAAEKQKQAQQQQPKQEQPKPEVKQTEQIPAAPETDNSVDEEEDDIFRPNTSKLTGPTVLGKIELPTADDKKSKRKKKRKRIDKERVDISEKGSETPKEGKKRHNKEGQGEKEGKGNKDRSNQKGGGNKDGKFDRNNKDGERNNNGGKGENRFNKGGKGKDNRRQPLPELTEEDVNKQIKETLAKLQGSKGKTKASKRRREKREEVRTKAAELEAQEEQEKKILKVTEFLTANELATLMDVQVNQVIATAFDLGEAVSINQRLDANLIDVIASEFGFDVEYIDADAEVTDDSEDENPEDLEPRPPIVTIMGHVDHGKTSLLDYIRNTNVIAGEAGGITQHIGAYNVELPDGKHITFLDTPGHEAFTAMRARGAKITDIAVIVIAADDSIMPQTEEAIAHAQAAGVPIIFAINKIDKPGANPDKIKEALANKNFLVEDWGGKYGSMDISAKKGINVDKLLDLILLQAEILELKANYHKPAIGSIIESSLDKGRGFVATIIVEGGVLKVGDVVWAGSHSGKIKAMFNERGKKITEARPAEPAVILGLDGAPVAGDKFKVMPDERSAREKANQRGMLEREMGARTQKHVTLEEIGRRIAIGNFQELNIIIKGDVQGSVEALTDSLEKLSTEEVQVKVIAKAVGQISESDVLLASASNALIIGFQVRPAASAKKLAEKEGISIKMYSIIYDAIDDVRDAMEGLLAPELKEEQTGTAEVQQLFKISKVGTIAGCLVKEGKIIRTNKCRVVRDGIVIFNGELASLKHYKDDAKEVPMGTECGLNIQGFNDLQVGDIIESYEEKEVKKTLPPIN
jgi:translation initiation factor IF-2